MAGPNAPHRLWRLRDRLRAALAPDLATYRSIDDALDEAVVVADDADWRIFKGREDPSIGPLEWTRLDFDDRMWETRPSGFGYGDPHLNTRLDDMMRTRDSTPGTDYTSLYVRREFEIPADAPYRHVELRVLFDDGFVAYLDGDDIAASDDTLIPDVGDPLAPREVGVPFPREAKGRDAHQPVEPLVHRAVVLPLDRLTPGRHVIALHGINGEPASSDFNLTPWIVAQRTRAAALRRGRELFETFREFARGDDAPARIAYFEARLLELDGQFAEAAEAFRRVISLDPESVVAAERLDACLRRHPDAAAREPEVRGRAPGERSE